MIFSATVKSSMVSGLPQYDSSSSTIVSKISGYDQYPYYIAVTHNPHFLWWKYNETDGWRHTNVVDDQVTSESSNPVSSSAIVSYLSQFLHQYDVVVTPAICTDRNLTQLSDIPDNTSMVFAASVKDHHFSGLPEYSSQYSICVSKINVASNFMYYTAVQYNTNKTWIRYGDTWTQLASVDDLTDTPIILKDNSTYSPDAGFSNRIIENCMVGCTDISCSVDVEFSDSSAVVFLGSEPGENSVIQKSHVRFSISNSSKLMRFYATGSGTSMPSTLVKSVDISSVVDGTKYRLEIGRKNRELYAKIVNHLTGQSVTGVVEDNPTGYTPYSGVAGWFGDKLNFGTVSGTATFKNIMIAVKSNPLVALVGDSITEGYLVPYDDCWAKKVYDWLDGDCIIIGRSGATASVVNAEIGDIVRKIKPKYTIVTVGTNGGNTESNLQAIIDAIEQSGSVPIINHISAYPSDGSTSISVNTMIDSLGNSSRAYFDIATSLNHDITAGQDSTLFMSDHVHPNSAGHLAMYNRFIADLGFIKQ